MDTTITVNITGIPAVTNALTVAAGALTTIASAPADQPHQDAAIARDALTQLARELSDAGAAITPVGDGQRAPRQHTPPSAAHDGASTVV